MKKLVIISLLSLLSFSLFSQAIPSKAEGFKYFVTFGNEAHESWGDDDFTQVLFFLIPKNYKRPFYIRIYDPDIGGEHDEAKGQFNSFVRFSVYGGKGAFSTPEAKSVDPVPGFNSGTRIYSKTFGKSPQYDQKYFVMGPFKPIDGEYVEAMGGYVVKVVIEGLKGDDGNLYNFFLSSDPQSNVAIDGANAFAYEYAIRLKADGKVAHIFPFIDAGITSVYLHNFDYDNDGEVFVYTVSKNREISSVSGDNVWATKNHKITKEEHNTSMDVQFYNKKGVNNNVTVYVLNQYKDAVGFFSAPIGGVPKYRYKVTVNITN